MDFAFGLGLLGAFLIWLVVAFTVRRWGPGVRRRRVRSPENARRRRARVAVKYVESGFGAVRADDVAACSLFGSGPVTCDRACLSRL